MKINLMLFLQELMLKTVESNIRPIQGDILDDPGFDAQFHNGYEVVKVTINYDLNECWVSLSPLAIEMEDISIEVYKKKLEANGWRILSKEDWLTSNDRTIGNV